MNIKHPFSHSIWVLCVRLILTAALITCMLFVSGSKPFAVASTQTNIYGPAGSGEFGQVTVLPNGNFVVVDNGYDAPGPIQDVGAVYLYNGATGALISKLTGSTTGDFTESHVLTLLSGNYLVISSNWDNGAEVDAGAVTWGNCATGVSGVVSAANSLVGTTAGNRVGWGAVLSLRNGNYVLASPLWDNGALVDAGAVTWMNGVTGLIGEVSAANSLIGSNAGDKVGFTLGEYLGDPGVIALSNGNYVVASSSWDNGPVANAGAVTWGNGMTGVNGVVSVANSLVGSTEGDVLGYTADNLVSKCGVTALANGNYVVSSSFWHKSVEAEVGAVTWGNGTTGTKGVVSAVNSLVGSTDGDRVGYSLFGVTELSNGNYVVRSPLWDNGGVADAGAVTWGNGTIGLSGEVSAANSLVGSTAGDKVGLTADNWYGQGDVTAIANGNYVVVSAFWDNGAVVNAGAVTWGNGTTGVIGPVSAANSLVGSTAGDRVGFSADDFDDMSGVSVLSNGNYVVVSSLWDNGAAADVGAVTWGNGTIGVSGVVSAANSLVGSVAGDLVVSPAGVLYYPSQKVTALANGNYLVMSPNWNNGAAAEAGAVTWGDGTTGVSGVVSAANSLVGSTAGDLVGSRSVLELNTGNYVVASPNWDHGAAVDVGAVTWGNGTTGVSGVVSAANSLVGSTAGDLLGGGSVTALINGNYVVESPYWHHGTVVDAGAVTWANGTTGLSGVVSADNSLVGSTSGDRVGYSWVAALANGNYVVGSPYWDYGKVVDAGAVTWGNGTTGVSGVVSADNSLVGSTAGDQVGSSWVTALTNGNYVMGSPDWHNGTRVDAGALTWGNGTTGVRGVVSAANSLVGSTAGDRVGDRDAIFAGVAVLSNDNYVMRSRFWDNDTAVDAGAVTFFTGTACASDFTVGPITAANSVLGTAADGGQNLNYGFDPIHQQLVVGRPADNMVSLFLPSDCAYHTFMPVIGN